jgi:hypothetical protein
MWKDTHQHCHFTRLPGSRKLMQGFEDFMADCNSQEALVAADMPGELLLLSTRTCYTALTKAPKTGDWTRRPFL